MSYKIFLHGAERGSVGGRLCVLRFWSTGSTECRCGRLPAPRPYCHTRSRALGLIDGESWGANNVLSQTCKMRTLASPVMKVTFMH